MESEDFIGIHAHNSSSGGNNSNELHDSKPQPSRDNLIDDKLQHKEADVGFGDDCMMETEFDKDLGDNPSLAHTNVELNETVSVAKKLSSSSSTIHTENGCLTTKDETSFGDRKKAGSSILGAKRARMAFDKQEPSVCVMYHSLTRDSKLKLEELLQQWSEWHAHNRSSSNDPNEESESGEETYFPALRIGEKSSAVSFRIDNQTSKPSKEFVPLDSKSVPMYDRGYALGLTSADGLNNLEGGLIVADASRCFNCGSYNHALRDCPRPRDNAAVNNARKEHNSKRNQNPGSRNPTRYYQNTPGGKYDGLKPGALHPETRKLMGLGDLDPPPWLNRMREIGYPPGYLDTDDENQPSGICIYGDEEVKEEGGEEGEITEAGHAELQKNKTVDFPGINAPIPRNADERLWLSSDRSRGQLNRPTSRGHQRRSHDYRDDGPPGCEPVSSLSSSSYPPRFSNYESSLHAYISRGNQSTTPRSPPTHGRSFNERGRRSPNHDGFHSLPYSSRLDYGSTRRESRTDYDHDHDHDTSFHNKYNPDMQHSRRW